MQKTLKMERKEINFFSWSKWVILRYPESPCQVIFSYSFCTSSIDDSGQRLDKDNPGENLHLSTCLNICICCLNDINMSVGRWGVVRMIRCRPNHFPLTLPRLHTLPLLLPSAFCRTLCLQNQRNTSHKIRQIHVKESEKYIIQNQTNKNIQSFSASTPQITPSALLLPSAGHCLQHFFTFCVSPRSGKVAILRQEYAREQLPSA